MRLRRGKNYNWSAHLANKCAATVVATFGPRLEASTLIMIKSEFESELG